MEFSRTTLGSKKNMREVEGFFYNRKMRMVGERIKKLKNWFCSSGCADEGAKSRK
jgi:hypothetical protein